MGAPGQLTIEPDHTIELLFIKLPHNCPDQCLCSDRWRGSQGAEAGEEVECSVGTGDLSTLRAREADGGAEDRPSWVWGMPREGRSLRIMLLL